MRPITDLRAVLAHFLIAAALTPADGSKEEQAESFEANPNAARDLMRLRLSYVHVDAGGDLSRVLFRINVGYASLIIPGLSLPKEYLSLFRVDVRAQSKHTSKTDAAGLEDLQILNLGGRMFSSLAIGAGYGMVVPTATDDAVGKGKLQLAPAVGAMFLGIRGARLGFLAQNFFDVAGDASRPPVNRLTFQPLLSYRITKDLFISSDATLEFDWQADENTVPVNFQIGYAFGPHVSIALGPEWVIAGRGQNDIATNLTIDFENW
jgi:hypothetical protein